MRGAKLALALSLLILTLAPAFAFAADQANSTKIYGYIESYWEKVGATPTGGLDGEGNTIWENNPYAFDVPDLHVMIKGNWGESYDYFLNLAARGAGDPASDAGVEVPNAWLEAKLYQNYVKVRAGKLYRKFDLYNEILDATPTYIGIEPPELFDKDHLMLTRTTNLMLLGVLGMGDATLNWSFTTGNDEKQADQIPVGCDLNVDYRSLIKVGASLYTSNGDAVPSRGMGDGSPKGGVVNWMASDKYTVAGGYVEVTTGDLIVQAAGYRANHVAVRDPEKVLQLVDAGINHDQAERFGLTSATPVVGDILTDVTYSALTYYLRAGYTFTLGTGEQNWSLTPYAQYDFYSNPETIAKKTFGGDNEAGLSDDGKFTKATFGVVIRPTYAIALKVDGSTHSLLANDKQVTYSEIRASLSYLWEL